MDRMLGGCIVQVASSMASRSGQVNEFVIVSMLNALRNTKLKRGQVRMCF